MSIDTTRIRCTVCDYEYFERYQPIELKCAFGPGTVTYYRTRCHECDRIRDAELLPSLTRLKRELLCLRGKGFSAWLRWIMPSHHARIRDKQNMIQWRQARTSLPRCLDCGSTKVSLLNYRHVSGSLSEAEGFYHSCGGRLVHDYNDKTGTRFSFRNTIIWLDLEGNRVEAKKS
jgi:hypothetical protein